MAQQYGFIEESIKMKDAIKTDRMYWLEKRAQRKTGFPMATLAFYGKNDQFACKAVVGVYVRSEEEDPMLKKWFVNDGDIRSDENISRQIVDFLQEHKIERIATLDKIIGCPHEEGIDYPLEGVCPECPFWANRDRYTGELIS